MSCRSARKWQIEHLDYKRERSEERDQRDQTGMQQPFEAMRRHIPERGGGGVQSRAGGWTEIAIGDVHAECSP